MLVLSGLMCNRLDIVGQSRNTPVFAIESDSPCRFENAVFVARPVDHQPNVSWRIARSQPRSLSSLFLPFFLLKVRTLDKPNPLKATYTVIHMFVVLLLASVPSFILNLPVGVVAR